VLAGAVLAGSALRLLSLGHGLPFVYNPDESSILARALSLASGSLNPHNFLYPSLFFYVIAGCVGALALAARATGRAPSLAAFESQFWQDPTTVYIAGRSLSAIAGVLTIVAVYRLALKAGDRSVARSAAWLMAVAYIPVRDAHFLKHDVPATLLVTVAALASWWVWRRGTARDYVVAGVGVGVAAAFHYPAALVVACLAVAHGLRARESAGAWLDRRIGIAGAAAALTFFVCSPYVILDFGTAVRDIQANRAIIVSRAQQVYGMFGSAWPQLEILRTQGAGIAWLIGAAVGLFALARRSRVTLLWLASFPVFFALFIANTWPFGRTANPLYPFLAVLGAAGLAWIAGRAGRYAGVVLTLLTIAAAAEPAALSWRFVQLMAETDTRTLAKGAIEANLEAGAGVAVEPYSVQLNTSREQLIAALDAAHVTPERAGRRVRAMLQREPYPSPAYRLYYIGEGGMDEDKIYIAPASLALRAGERAPATPCLDVIVLKRAAPHGDNPLSKVVPAYAYKVLEESPFTDPAVAGDGFLADFDVRPSWNVVRPGPVIEVWQAHTPCGAQGGTP